MTIFQSLLYAGRIALQLLNLLSNVKTNTFYKDNENRKITYELNFSFLTFLNMFCMQVKQG